MVKKFISFYIIELHMYMYIFIYRFCSYSVLGVNMWFQAITWMNGLHCEDDKLRLDDGSRIFCSLRSCCYSGCRRYVISLRAIAEYLSHDLPYKLSPDDAFVTSGCTQAIDVALSMLARPGVNILLPRPGFPIYELCAAFRHLEVRHFDLLPKKGWEVDLDAVEALADHNTAAMIVEQLKKYFDILGGPSTFIQAAVPRILQQTEDVFFTKTINILKQTSDICCERIKEIPCISCPYKPVGSMAVMVMFSTDGYAFPETFYLGAKRAREVVFSVLRDACIDGDLSIPEAIEAAKTYFQRMQKDIWWSSQCWEPQIRRNRSF